MGDGLGRAALRAGVAMAVSHANRAGRTPTMTGSLNGTCGQRPSVSCGPNAWHGRPSPGGRGEKGRFRASGDEVLFAAA